MLYSGMLFKTVCMPKISYGFATYVVKKRKYVRWISADMQMDLNLGYLSGYRI